MEEISTENTLMQAKDMSGDDMLQSILADFVEGYTEKPEKQTDEEWLQGRLLAQLPELSADLAASQSREAVEAIHVYDKNLESLLKARKQNKTSIQWFVEHVRKSSAGKENTEMAARLTVLYSSLEETTAPSDEVVSQAPQVSPAQETQKWTDSELHQLAKMTGRQVMQAGARSAVQFAEYDSENTTKRTVKTEEAVSQALTTGKDAGLKTAVTGALTVAAKKQVIQVTQGEVSVAVYANLACMSVENVKTAVQVAEHKITETEAGGRMVANFLVAATNVVCETAGGVLGMLAASEIPILAPLTRKVGAKLGKEVAKAAGPKIEEKVRKANGLIASSLKRMIKKTGDAVHEAKNEIKAEVKKKMKSLKSLFA